MFAKGFLIILHEPSLVVSREISDIYRVLMFINSLLEKAVGGLKEVPGVYIEAPGYCCGPHLLSCTCVHESSPWLFTDDTRSQFSERCFLVSAPEV